MLLLLALACSPAPASLGVYRSGQNAVTHGARAGTVRAWGAAGTLERLASPGPGGTTFLGEAGPLWLVDRDVPAPPKAPVVAAPIVERAGWRMRELLGAVSTGGPDPVRGSGVYVRSVVKTRRENAPPVYVVAATRDTQGSGLYNGPAEKREGANCEAAVGTMDDKGERLLSAVKLEVATRLCVVPTVLGPVDLDANGISDVLVYGQTGQKGFRAWFELHPDGTLVAGPADSWDTIP